MAIKKYRLNVEKLNQYFLKFESQKFLSIHFDTLYFRFYFVKVLIFLKTNKVTFHLKLSLLKFSYLTKTS